MTVEPTAFAATPHRTASQAELPAPRLYNQACEQHLTMAKGRASQASWSTDESDDGLDVDHDQQPRFRPRSPSQREQHDGIDVGGARMQQQPNTTPRRGKASAHSGTAADPITLDLDSDSDSCPDGRAGKRRRVLVPAPQLAADAQYAQQLQQEEDGRAATAGERRRVQDPAPQLAADEQYAQQLQQEEDGRAAQAQAQQADAAAAETVKAEQERTASAASASSPAMLGAHVVELLRGAGLPRGSVVNYDHAVAFISRYQRELPWGRPHGRIVTVWVARCLDGCSPHIV